MRPTVQAAMQVNCIQLWHKAIRGHSSDATCSFLGSFRGRIWYHHSHSFSSLGVRFKKVLHLYQYLYQYRNLDRFSRVEVHAFMFGACFFGEDTQCTRLFNNFALGSLKMLGCNWTPQVQTYPPRPCSKSLTDILTSSHTTFRRSHISVAHTCQSLRPLTTYLQQNKVSRCPTPPQLRSHQAKPALQTSSQHSQQHCIPQPTYSSISPSPRPSLSSLP